MQKGIVREIDALGRLVIPKELRDELGLLKGEPVEMIGTDGAVLIKKYSETCLICGKKSSNGEKMEIINGKRLCNDCIKKIKDI